VVADFPYGLELAAWNTKNWAEEEFFTDFFEKLLSIVVQSNNCATWTWIMFYAVSQVPYISKCLENRNISYDNFYWIKNSHSQPGLRYTSAVVSFIIL
jgi:hypothetical protein